ncbi:MAG: ATP-binding cassette domain-containing protein [Chloroflexi bacterium]|nr:ATP-binding cassette domain-containing protein [Chloroflexota bacterium]
MLQIEIKHLKKYYQVHQKEAGLRGSLQSFFHRKYFDVKAVDDVSFSIEAGQRVGFLGPNGAGKTTTLKVLSGLLYPTSGEVSVLGYTPYERKPAFLRQFTLVMGQKNQLLWDLPALETFLVNQAIYEIPDADFKRTLAELDDLLELEPLLKKQVRKLSLGERMKCELAAALLHRPRVLFLDEPTIGLDVTMQTRIRDFIAAYNQRYQATVLLTSHYMADVAALTSRVIVIHHGHLLYDGDLRSLSEEMAPFKIVKIVLAQPLPTLELSAYGKVRSWDGVKIEIEVPRDLTTHVATRLLNELVVADVTIEDPPLEEVISRVFASATLPLESVT